MVYFAVIQADHPAGPQPLPVEVVEAWKKAGAVVGWIGIDGDKCGHLEFRCAAEGKQGEVPAFRFPEWRPGEMAQLPQPPRPFGLDLTLTQVTDAGLQELIGLNHLQTLNLSSCTRVTDDGLKEFARLKNLRILSLWSTRVTDAGLEQLAGMQNLAALDLAWTRVTNAGLKQLAGLKNLQTLDLDDTQVTDAGLNELVGLKDLRTMNLSHTQFSDTG